MKRLLLPLVAAIALPTAVNAEVTNDHILKLTECTNLYNEGKFDEMKNIGNELIEISPDSPDGYLCKGLALFWTSKNNSKIKREAINNFTKATEINPEDIVATYFKGALQFSLNRTRKSEITACNDIKKTYLVNFPPALEFVKKNKSFLRKTCKDF